LNRWS